jgi:phosphate transport system substrate-binding protein
MIECPIFREVYMKKIILFLAITSLFLGCATIPLRFTESDLPPIDSSTATQPLMVKSISTLLDIDEEQANKRYPHTHTFQAYKKLISGEVDIILSLKPNEELKAMAKDNGVEFEYIAIGKDAFVFIVNKGNPIEDLTLQEIQQIYTGKIDNWSQVGGFDEAIVPFQRQHESGSQAIMENVVMQGLQMIEAPSTEVNTGMGTMNDRLSYDNSINAIGYNIYYFTTYMHPDENIKMLSINGVAPTKDSIQTNEYIFTGEIYAIIRSDEESDSNARKMQKWFLSEEGQQIVEESGYVPIF